MELLADLEKGWGLLAQGGQQSPHSRKWSPWGGVGVSSFSALSLLSQDQ